MSKQLLLACWRMTSGKRGGRRPRLKMRMRCSGSGGLVSVPTKTVCVCADMGLEYAATFFLLADRLRDAVHLLMNQVGDLQLAIAITRAYEGDDGPMLREILEERVLPEAASDGNRWMASWAFWILGRRDMAVRSLIVSPCPALRSTKYPALLTTSSHPLNHSSRQRLHHPEAQASSHYRQSRISPTTQHS